MPNSLREIGEAAFSNCDNLTVVELNEGLIELGNYLFSSSIPDEDQSGNIITHHSNLTTINLPGTLKKIGDGCFGGCEMLTGITIPESITELPDGAFGGCKNLSEVNLPSHLTSIGRRAFTHCSSLPSSLVIPESVKSIGSQAFAMCSSITDIQLSPNLKKIEEYTFNGTNITSIIIPEGVISIENCAFGHCTNLSSVTLPNTLKHLSGFTGCKSLTSIMLPEGLESIHGLNGTGITSIIIPNSVITIGPDAFSGLNLSSVTLPEGLDSIGSGAFEGCKELTEITLPQSVSRIGLSAFRSCSKLSEINILSEITELPMLVFANNSSLTSVTLPEGITIIGRMAFASCSNLSSVNIPLSVSIIDEYAFADCTKLKNVNFEMGDRYVSGIRKIRERAFYNCGFESLDIPITVDSIGKYVFASCTSLSSVLVHWPEPIEVPTDAFSYAITPIYNTIADGPHATLYVPDNSLNLYKTSSGWRSFNNVRGLSEYDNEPDVPEIPDNPVNPIDPSVVDTDIALLDNVIYVERQEGKVGSQLRLSVKMKNSVAVQGYQFDLYLPDGVTVATDEDGFAMAELSTARTTANKTNYFDSAPTADGALRVLCGSSKGYTFSGNDGEVAVITLNISQDIEEGEHPIVLRTIKLSDSNAVPYTTDYLKSTLVISSYTLGDVNADGEIDVADFIAIANHILGKTAENFVEKAADANEDGSIDVADFIAVANMILHNNVSQHMPMRHAPRKVATDVSTLDNAIYVEPVEMAAGSQQVLSVKMKNANAVAGYQFNVALPDGMTFAMDEDNAPLAELSTERTTTRRTNYFDSALQSDGTLMVLCGTTNKNTETDELYAFSGNDGEIARITVNVPTNFAAGEYPVIIKNAIISDPEAMKTELQAAIESTVTVTMSDNRILLAETSTSMPEAATDVDVRVMRTINAGEWSTIVLPFAMSAAQVKAAFGNDVALSDFTGYQSEEDEEGNVISITVNFATVTAIEANHPYIIKVSAPVTEFTVDGVDIEPEDEPTVATVKRTRKAWSELIGTYVAGTEVPSKTLFLSGNKFYYSTGATKMKAFRAYFDFFDVLTNVDESYDVKMAIFVDGKATGIDGMINGQRRMDHIYDLGGRRIAKPQQRGIYIVNGRKTLVY